MARHSTEVASRTYGKANKRERMEDPSTAGRDKSGEHMAETKRALIDAQGHINRELALEIADELAALFDRHELDPVEVSVVLNSVHQIYADKIREATIKRLMESGMGVAVLEPDENGNLKVVQGEQPPPEVMEKLHAKMAEMKASSPEAKSEIEETKPNKGSWKVIRGGNA